MEQLVTFLTSNIQFVIVIVGILYFLFFRKSPLEKRPPNRMPDFGGEARRPPERPARPRSLPERPMADLGGDRPPNVVYAPEASYAEAIKADESDDYERAAASSAEPKRAGGREGGSRSGGGASQRDLARAVLWSEILGRPRARKPYRR